MAWQIKFTKAADKAFRKLNKQTADKILNKIEEISKFSDPRCKGKVLQGNLLGLWRYRVGDYRIICDIEDDILLIIVVDVAHRSKVYRKRK